jgi:hypothetical protein
MKAIFAHLGPSFLTKMPSTDLHNALLPTGLVVVTFCSFLLLRPKSCPRKYITGLGKSQEKFLDHQEWVKPKDRPKE